MKLLDNTMALNLSSPWYTYYKKLKAMFEKDDEIRLLFDDVDHNIQMYVEDPDKASALAFILPEEVQFGSVTLTITIVPANGALKKVDKNVDADCVDYEELFEEAFYGNAAHIYTKDVEIAGFHAVYVVFEKKVVQFPNDDIGDINGVCSTLYEDIARDIFDVHAGIFFCTSTGADDDDDDDEELFF